MTGSYDPDTNLTYWGIGNPGPDWNADLRLGDNLYSDCVVALDADTGSLKWYSSSLRTTISISTPSRCPCSPISIGKARGAECLLWANRNGFFYVLDRTTGEFLRAAPFAKVTWAHGLDERGRPMRAANMTPTAEGTKSIRKSRRNQLVFAVLQPDTGLFTFPSGTTIIRST